ncbi:ATP-binding protein [Actinoplanes awajinensis]|uniref:Histidine kinase/HSP90-like ATPase domain-containing protein n=1 Tax=Actinoplanes awajinensis subsp. mycoplanecinus TaxID=135947 RepID=A0A0X3VDK2_9ACTN|nr:ATP-binding protein [Actinoplanes awajinensis]KUL41386.1 hypothetical protein ADL15_03795 [Actinoplanes awajinensis subsp. mycoplanecinus]
MRTGGRSQPPRPPYLVTTGTDRHAVSVGVTADASTTVVELTVHGRWSPELADQVIVTLRMCLAGPAAVIIIDLHDVGDLHGVSGGFWAAAARAAHLGPAPAQLVLCLPATTMLDLRVRNGDGPPMPVFATMADARRAVAGRLVHGSRLQARLGPRPSSVAAARDLVVQACHRWHLLPLQGDACLVVSELAANAVQHAGGDLVVTVSRSGARLHLAVRDGDSRYPRLPGPARDDGPLPLAERGRGLPLVHAVAMAWGALPARAGKVVWATLSTAPGRVSP